MARFENGGFCVDCFDPFCIVEGTIGQKAPFVILPWLGFRYLATGPSGAFGTWMLAVILINGICLMIDIVDVIRYFAGERKPIVAPGS